MNIRQMSIDDLDFVLKLTAHEGWTSTRRDFEELLNFNPTGSFIGEIDREPIGMICTTSYGSFGFLGNLIVETSFRGFNYGRILMEYAIENLERQGCNSILLDGVPKAVSLYEKLGFRKVSRSLRLVGNASGRGAIHVRPMVARDLNEVIDMDAQQFGGHRDEFLRLRYSAFPELSHILEVDGIINGFIMGSESGTTTRIGPWVMINHIPESEELLLALSQNSTREPLKIGVLESNKEALKILNKYGFTETSYSWRMIRGKDTEATLSDHLYAICCPARG